MSLGYVVIPTRGDIANYDQKIKIEGKVFSFRFRYNQRDNCWYVNIWDNLGNPVKNSLKLVPNYLLMRWMKDASWGIGELASMDARPNPVPAVLADLTSNIKFVYVGINP